MDYQAGYEDGYLDSTICPHCGSDKAKYDYQCADCEKFEASKRQDYDEEVEEAS